MAKPMRINQDVVEMEYAVRGPIPQRAAEMKRRGRRTIPCNIGNPQALGQKPITYYRQVLSLLEDPARIGRERRLTRLAQVAGPAEGAEGLNGLDILPDDVLAVAEDMLRRMETGMGAYTDSKGPLFIREAIARYIDRRDGVQASGGVPSDPESIFITDGASEGAKNALEILIAKPTDGIMIPIPQYPLYSATIKRCGGTQVNYYPDEDEGWALNKPILEASLEGARRSGIDVKAIVVINPANPTGAILDEQSVRDVIAFAGEHGLAIIADEVYQDNLYGAAFHSFARMVGRQDIPLFSLHSTSKGFYGECGHRGGYLEVRNPPAISQGGLAFKDVLFKQASVNLCSNTAGQALVYLMVSPPREGSASHPLFIKEKARILDDLYDKAVMIREAFNEMEGVQCFGRIGAMYLFPRLSVLPPGTNDFDYCMSLLETTGLCTVNGEGFGQREGTSHLRIAFLPPREMLAEVLPEWIRFHNRYVASSR